MHQVGFLGFATILILGCAQVDPNSPLSSYYDEGDGSIDGVSQGCGPRGDNFNNLWCKFGPSSCLAMVDVDTTVCKTGKAVFDSNEGNGLATEPPQVVVDGCSYRFIAQYKCDETARCDTFSGCPPQLPVNKGSSMECSGETTATCNISTCCEAQGTCHGFSACNETVAVHKGSGVKCSGNQSSCDQSSCCEAKATCADFSGCSAPLAAQKGSSVICSGSVATCDRDLCCEAQGTCDSFSTCPRSMPNKGKTVSCTGTSASCDASTCCEGVTLAPTPAPMSALATTTPAPGSTIVRGSLKFTVSDPRLFVEKEEVVDALVGALAEVFSLNVDAVSIASVTLVGGRRLRRLTAGTVKVDYQLSGNVQEGVIMDAGPLIMSTLQNKLDEAGISLSVSATVVSKPIITTVEFDDEAKVEESPSIVPMVVGIAAALACLSTLVVFLRCRVRKSLRRQKALHDEPLETPSMQLCLEDGRVDDEEEEEEDDEGEEEEDEEDGGQDDNENDKKKKAKKRRKKTKKGGKRKVKGDESTSLTDAEYPAVYTVEEIRTQNAALKSELAVLEARTPQVPEEPSQASAQPAVNMDSMKADDRDQDNPRESIGLTGSWSLDVSTGLIQASSIDASDSSKPPEEEPQKAKEEPPSADVGKGGGWTEAFLRRQGTGWMAQKLIELAGRSESTNAKERAADRKTKKPEKADRVNLLAPPIGKSGTDSCTSTDTTFTQSPRAGGRTHKASAAYGLDGRKITRSASVSGTASTPLESQALPGGRRKPPAKRTSDISNGPVDKPRPPRKKTQSAMA